MSSDKLLIENERGSETRIIVLTGPTAIGKTDVAVGLAANIGGEIISADSMQIYKGMKIGTAQPDEQVLKQVPHHLIGFVPPSEEYSAAKFQTEARRLIKEISKKGKIPIVAGGSGLYIRSIIDPLDWPTAHPDSAKRASLERLASDDPDKLLSRLRAVDPAGAAKIDPRNIRRVIRAIEAAELTKEPLAVREERWRRREAVFAVQIIGLRMNRNKLYELINERVDEMVKKGLEDEVRGLMGRKGGLSKTASQALGYKEMIDYIEGALSFVQAVELIKKRTRRLAKRQFTWLAADPRVVWIDIDDRTTQSVTDDILDLVKARGFIVS